MDVDGWQPILSAPKCRSAICALRAFGVYAIRDVSRETSRCGVARCPCFMDIPVPWGRIRMSIVDVVSGEVIDNVPIATEGGMRGQCLRQLRLSGCVLRVDLGIGCVGRFF